VVHAVAYPLQILIGDVADDCIQVEIPSRTLVMLSNQFESTISATIQVP